MQRRQVLAAALVAGAAVNIQARYTPVERPRSWASTA